MGHQVTAIRQFASSRTGNVLLAAEFERFIHLYDLQTLERLRTFETTLDYGGHRLAVSNDGKMAVVGAYHVHGVAAYSCADGAEMWRRKDLKKPQQIVFTGDDSRVLCCFDNGPCESLSASAGKSGRSLRGVRRVWESSFAPVRFLERSRDYAIADLEAPIASIRRASFAVLSAAFSPSSVCISEAGGPVRAFDSSSGSEVWRHTPPKGTHFLRVSYSEDIRSFVGVSWSFEKGGKLFLQVFNAESGVPTIVIDVGPSTEMAFCVRGTRLITDAGAMFDVATGQQIAMLPFPVGRPSSR